MANAPQSGWGGTSGTSSGSPSGWGGASTYTPSAKKSGGGGLFNKIVHATEGTLASIGTGIANQATDEYHAIGKTIHHPIISTKGGYFHPQDPNAADKQMHTLGAMIQSEKNYYNPLVHGHLGAFGKNVEHNPINLAFDLATVLTAGGSAAARLDALGAKAGLTPGRLGTAADLTVPDLAKQAGQPGNDVLLRRSSQNPVIRARQVAVNKALNAARPDIPLIGSEARLGRAVARKASREGQSLAAKSAAFDNSFDRLNKHEKVVWHLHMRAVDPHAWAQLLKEGAIKNPLGTEATLSKWLQDKKVNDLYRNPSKRINQALDAGRNLSDLMTAEKVKRGYITETTAAESPYKSLRVLHEDESVPAMAHRIAAEGKIQPHYVPDTAETGKLPRQSWRPSGSNPPAPLKSTRHNEGILFKKGAINVHGNALGTEMRLFARHVQRTNINSALQEVAAKEPETGLPRGYTYLKTVSGEKSAPYTDRAAAELTHVLGSPEESKGELLKRFTTTDPKDENIATDGEGHRLIVPDSVAEQLAVHARPTRSLVQWLLYNKPTTVWKHLVLGLRPAYLPNIILSQHILGVTQMAGGGKGFFAYINHLIPGARLGKLTDATIEDVMPEQASSSFSGSTGVAGHSKQIGKLRIPTGGVMGPTLKAETWLRRLMIEGWAKSEPAVQAALKENGGDINAALRQVAKSDPHVIDDISQRVDHAQGNYRSYTPAEEKLRQVVPFYGWDRHIVQSTLRILLERPGVANYGIKSGQQGQKNIKALYGDLPPYLQGIVSLGGNTVLSTKAVNPFGSLSDIVAATQGGSPDTLNAINPIIPALIEWKTGKSLVTGQPLKGTHNPILRLIEGLPQARLAAAALGKHPLGQSKHPTSNSADFWAQLEALLGYPKKTLNVANANAAAKLP